eukprot:scaffold29753_cov22-Tisochrysis_lutea.AAC.3
MFFLLMRDLIHEVCAPLQGGGYGLEGAIQVLRALQALAAYVQFDGALTLHAAHQSFKYT